MRAVLVRHCEPDRARDIADPPLSMRGQLQARLVARRLAELGVSDAVYASPLRRARETAAAIGEAQQQSVRIEPALTIDAATGVDDLSNYQARAWAFLESLQAGEAVETVTCVSHEIVILPLICRAIGLPLERIGQLRQPIASFSIIEFRRDRVQIAVLNETCHLNDLP